MKLLLTIAAGVAIGILAVVMLASAGEQSARSDLAARLQTVAAQAQHELDRMTADDVVKARRGHSADVVSDDASVVLSVRVRRIIDPLPVGEYDAAGANHHFVGVEIRVKNTGTHATSAAGTTRLVYSDGHAAHEAIVSGGDCQGTETDAAIAPGDAAVVCSPFEVRDDRRVSRVQFTIATPGGPASITAQWPA